MGVNRIAQPLPDAPVAATGARPARARLRGCRVLALCFLASVAAADAWGGPKEDWVALTAAFDRGDVATGLRLLRALAEKGDADAQYDLGALYHAGVDVPQDFVQAYKWYTLAIARFTAAEKSMRERAQKSRGRIAATMTPSEIAAGERQAGEWRPR
jgi:TPR repeat protein